MLAAALLLAALPSAAAGATPLTPEQVVDMRHVRQVVTAPEGDVLFFMLEVPRKEGEEPGLNHSEIHQVNASGGNSRVLVRAPGRALDPLPSPDGRWLAFRSKRGEDEHVQIYLLPRAGGEARRLTSSPSAVASMAWAPDAQRMTYVALDPEDEARKAAKKAGRDEIVESTRHRPRRLWQVDVAGGESRVLARTDDSIWDHAWFPDGKRIVATMTEKSDIDSSYIKKWVAVISAAGGSVDVLWDGPGKIGAPAVSPDSRWIAVNAGTSPDDPSAGALFVIDARSGAAVNRTPGLQATATWAGWRSAAEAVFTAHQGTGSVLYGVGPREGVLRSLASGPPIFSAASFDRSGQVAGVVASTPTRPPEVHRWSADGGFQRLTDTNPQITGAALGKQEVYRWAASDGLDLEGILIHPVGAGEPGGPRPPYPLVTVVHGGPESCWHHGWNTSYSRWGQVLAGRGYAVLMANYRASTGRGVAFGKADHQDLGGREFRDLLQGIDSLIEDGLVDRQRVGTGGGSYGGYFSAWAATRHSERFAAAVVFAGISNWLSFTGTSDIPEENSRVHWNLDPYRRADLAWDRSPVAHLDDAETPVLIAHGEKDLRVPLSQGQELYTALRLRGTPVELVRYPREPHGLREKAHQLDYMHRALDWFDQHVKNRERRARSGAAR